MEGTEISHTIPPIYNTNMVKYKEKEHRLTIWRPAFSNPSSVTFHFYKISASFSSLIGEPTSQSHGGTQRE